MTENEYEQDFEIGDRVICTRSNPDGNRFIVAGVKGTVCSISGMIGVSWDIKVGGHDCDSTYCTPGHGWWINREYIKLEESDNVEIDAEKFTEVISG